MNIAGSSPRELSSLRIGVLGLGAVGSRVVRQLAPAVTQAGGELWAHDLHSTALVRTSHVAFVGYDDIARCDVVVVATPAPQTPHAVRLLAAGSDVVCTTDDLTDLRDLTELASLSPGQRLVVGASVAPGLSGLLARFLADRLDDVDEIHIAVHGTGGPSCARQHHRALAGRAIGWHDGSWLHRPAGSGRELCWFPQPIGPRDCYRAELGDPLMLTRVFPTASRVTARVSATRRDRLTARLPMLSPPHAEGGIGALRVEVRGQRDGQRVALVAGESERAAVATAAVAATFAARISELPEGPLVAGDASLPTASLLAQIVERGVALWEFVGSEYEPRAGSSRYAGADGDGG